MGEYQSRIKKLFIFFMGGVLVIGVVVLWGREQEDVQQNTTEAKQLNEQSKGQYEKSAYFSTTFSPLPSASDLSKKALSFITKEENTNKDDAKNKGTFGIFEDTKQKTSQEAKIFEIMFPEPTLRSFRENQQKLVAIGVMAESEVIPLLSEADIEKYLQRRFESYLNEPSVSSDEKVIARRAIARLPSVLASERTRAERILRGASAEGVPSPLASLLSLSTPVAQAMWYTLPDCYKDDNPQSRVRGFSGIAQCCNCGEFCSEGCEYFEDCGINNVKCNVPQGCLNLECGYYQNAIWDSTTGICGCG